MLEKFYYWLAENVVKHDPPVSIASFTRIALERFAGNNITTELVDGVTWSEFDEAERRIGIVWDKGESNPKIFSVSAADGRVLGYASFKNQRELMWYLLVWSHKIIGIIDRIIVPTEPSAPIPGPVPPAPKTRVLIDPGHSDRQPGATGKNRSVREYDLNLIQAANLDEALSRTGNFEVDIFDPADDDIYKIGARARGYDLFVSLHLNAFNGEEHYTCAVLDPRFRNKAIERLASEVALSVAAAINNALPSQAVGYPVGILPRKLTVIRAANENDCTTAFLLETEFIDDEVNSVGITSRIRLAMEAAANEINKHFWG